MSGIDTSLTTVATTATLNKLVDNLYTSIQNETHGSSTSLLQLKTWQRQIFQDTRQASARSRQLQVEREKKQQQLDSLRYEHEHLQQQIAHLSKISTKVKQQLPNLYKLASTQLDENHSGTDNTVVSEYSVIETYLNDSISLKNDSHCVSIFNPSHRQLITDSLHNEIRQRKLLINRHDILNKQLQNVKTSLKESKMLNQLPNQLAAVERASLPLQRYIKDYFDTTSHDAPSLHIGTERATMIEMAQKLPAPLYTLYRQLQLYVDNEICVPHGQITSVQIVLPSDPRMCNVVLQLSLPNVSAASLLSGSSMAGKVLLCFYYDAISNVVTVSSAGSKHSVKHLTLLQDLFSETNDSSEDLVDTINNDDSSNNLPGKPYYWANYLAGLHPMPCRQGDQFLPSTRGIMYKLQQRLQSNVTLKFIMSTISKTGCPPVLPAEVAERLNIKNYTDEKIQLQKFTKVDDSTKKSNSNMRSHTKVWSMVLAGSPLFNSIDKNVMQQQLAAPQLQLTLTVDSVHYPASPPVWACSYNNGSSTSYSNMVDDILKRVNVEILQEVIEASNGNDDTLCNWIIVVQLYEISKWWSAVAVKLS